MSSSPPSDALLESLFLKFAQADSCWFSSVRPDGRAHLAPVWHLWHAQRVYVVTPSSSVRARNVAVNPAVSLSLPDPMNVLIIEGRACTAPQMAEVLQPLFQTKYEWDIRTDAGYDLILCVTPRKVMAWGSHGDGRWHFDDDIEAAPLP